jgi:hypothetical protein
VLVDCAFKDEVGTVIADQRDRGLRSVTVRFSDGTIAYFHPSELGRPQLSLPVS